MLLDVEHFHSMVNFKSNLQTMLQYAREFTTSIKESCKGITKWGAHYYTRRKRWYLPPENSLYFSEITLPKPLPPKQIENDNSNLLREWAAVNGAAMRQRTIHQETTMAWSGTLPDACYRTGIRIDEKGDHDQIFSETENINAKEIDKWSQRWRKFNNQWYCNFAIGKDQTDEYSSESIDEYKEESNSDDDSQKEITMNEVEKETTILIGRKSRFGRPIKYNNRFLNWI